MADKPRYRSLVEQPEYSAQLNALIKRYSLELITPVLEGLYWGIATNPRAHGRALYWLRVAKSRSLNPAIPSLRILFQVQNEGGEDERVLLCWIEEISAMEDLLGY